ncbi:MAG: SDR family oxidoreductase [Deltaproteobacteria bacterium]|nr:SDR family oxidoreductase [Deltaproteobacteria bacterium]
MPLPPSKLLLGRVALVTGVSRRIGIGFAIVRRLLEDGASVLATGWTPHDEEMPWGPGDKQGDELLAELGEPVSRLQFVAENLEDPDAPDRLVASVVERFGSIDIVVANHARSSHESLWDVSAEELDRSWAINARASMLLARSLARARAAGPGGRVILFTSAQHQGPMWKEIAWLVGEEGRWITGQVINHDGGFRLV